MPPWDFNTSRGKAMAPSVPQSWATDASSPFASPTEHLELQGQDCGAISTSKNDRGRSVATCFSGFAAAFDRAVARPSRSRAFPPMCRTFRLSVAPSSRARQAGHF
eukprot:2318540-Alexandrium_andersonii.AAC.1